MSVDPTDPIADEAGLMDPGSYRLRYQEAFEFSLDARMATDEQGVILEANHAAASLLGCRKEFLIGKPLGLFVVNGNRNLFYQALLRLIRAATSDQFEVKVGRGGKPRDVAMKVSRTDSANGRATGLRWLLQDVTEQHQEIAARADLLRRLVTAQEDERRRVARELHDSVGQLLSALSLAVQSVRDAEQLTSSTLTRLDVVQRVADELGRTTHDLAVRLRPTALDDFGLKVALQALIKDWSERTGVDADFQSVGLETIRFAPEVETALYRVIQEALTNITKHAAARLVSVVLERRRGDAIMVVEDDGVGFDLDEVASTGRLGLLGMRERMTLVGGSLQIEAAPRAGTLIRVRVPIHFPPQGA